MYIFRYRMFCVRLSVIRGASTWRVQVGRIGVFEMEDRQRPITNKYIRVNEVPSTGHTPPCQPGHMADRQCSDIGRNLIWIGKKQQLKAQQHRINIK